MAQLPPFPYLQMSPFFLQLPLQLCQLLPVGEFLRMNQAEAGGKPWTKLWGDLGNTGENIYS